MSIYTKTLGAALAVSLSTVAYAEPINLKFGSTAPARAHLNHQIYAPWSEKVTQASEGTLKVEFIPGSVLGSDGQMLERVNSGVADIGFDLQAYYPGKFPRTDVISVPFIFSKSSSASVALWRLVEQGVIPEYDEVVLLNIFAFTNAIPMMRSDIKSLSGLKGQKIAVGGKMRSLVAGAMGATPVSVLIGEIYQALNRGVVDGALLPWTAVQPFRVQEVTSSYLEVPLGASSGFVFMNKRKFNALPAKAKSAIMDNSGEKWVAHFGKFWDRIEDEGRAIIQKAGGKTIIKVDGPELDQWREAMEPVEAQWIKDTPDGEKVVDAFRAELNRIEQ